LSKNSLFSFLQSFLAILKVIMIGNYNVPLLFWILNRVLFFPHRIDFESLSYSTRFWLYQYITCVVAVFWCWWCCQNTVGLELLARNVGLEQHPTSHRKTGNESKKSFFQNRHFFLRFLTFTVKILLKFIVKFKMYFVQMIILCVSCAKVVNLLSCPSFLIKEVNYFLC
jgi:hypothetical protein